MKPKEKAWDLVQKKYSDNIYMFLKDGVSTTNVSKICALICVDEIIKMEDEAGVASYTKSASKYWEQVKQELTNL